MKKNFFFYFTVFILCIPIISQAKSSWYDQLLPSTEKYHSDFILKSKETRTITFETKDKLLVGFWTNPSQISSKQINQYMGNFPISIEHKEEKRIIKSLFGSSCLFYPVKNKILLQVHNNSEDDFEIVIYTHPLDFAY